MVDLCDTCLPHVAEESLLITHHQEEEGGLILILRLLIVDILLGINVAFETLKGLFDKLQIQLESGGLYIRLVVGRSWGC